jgi:hypothetical protein
VKYANGASVIVKKTGATGVVHIARAARAGDAEDAYQVWIDHDPHPPSQWEGWFWEHELLDAPHGGT